MSFGGDKGQADIAERAMFLTVFTDHPDPFAEPVKAKIYQLLDSETVGYFTSTQRWKELAAPSLLL